MLPKEDESGGWRSAGTEMSGTTPRVRLQAPRSDRLERA
jgi:hypothetical protein